MAILNRYDSCRGLTLFKWGQLRVEVWYCPAGYTIIEHSHPSEDVELMYVFGSTTFYRRDIRDDKVESVKCGIKYLFRKFSVRFFHSHWFSVGRLPLIFINFQRFLPGNKPVSAAIDFKIATK